MDIIVKGRRTDVNDRFRRHVDTKLMKIEKLDQKVIRVDVEVLEERNPRQADRRERVELTIRSRGPVIRAEAAADDRYAALDLALDKLEGRMRRIADRRKGHQNGRSHARRAPAEPVEPVVPTFAEPVATMVAEPRTAPDTDRDTDYETDYDARPDGDIVPIPVQGDCPVVVREKFHKAEPMSVEQALFEMELVGHDFFLFRDSDCGQPSVVYRRRGWDYGIIRLVEE
ncbi:ribosome-associated translation inhibitor RaiA [Actinomadura craniellae]|uniref:Ribosome hibernation promoting factor n=1 Tax=Actinomadura craniellae TaxID=2231787 RepID=A0A365H5G7_9ACTN|nr:ribosome-associated translation inhibitor RaiA [Actinomadura craniellae]RAY14289.1 ribosome-associated translation inhibitor RaiA [Actinomadura craniellae]